MARKGVDLTPETWLLKVCEASERLVNCLLTCQLIMGPIDSSYDTKDE